MSMFLRQLLQLSANTVPLHSLHRKLPVGSNWRIMGRRAEERTDSGRGAVRSEATSGRVVSYSGKRYAAVTSLQSSLQLLLHSIPPPAFLNPSPDIRSSNRSCVDVDSIIDSGVVNTFNEVVE